MNGTPRDLLPGDPICAPIRTILAETSVSLVRSLSLHPVWKDHVVSAIMKGLQDIRNVLLSSSDKGVVDKDSIKNQGYCIVNSNKDNTQVRWNKQSNELITNGVLPPSGSFLRKN